MVCNQYLGECVTCLKKNMLLINKLGFHDRKHEAIQVVFLS